MYLREAQLKLHPNTAAGLKTQPRADWEFLETEIPMEIQSNTDNELINKAKIQVERLKNSFAPLIQSQKLKQTYLSYDQIEFNRKHLNFNKSIKAYVDVCCNTPGLVSYKLSGY